MESTEETRRILSPATVTMPRLTGQDTNPETWEVSFGDFNGDGVDDVLLENGIGEGYTVGPPLLLYFYSGSQSRRMVEAVDGYNKSVQFTYNPLSNSGIYTQPQAANYRSNTNSSNLLDIQAPIYVVSRLTSVDGSGTETNTSTLKKIKVMR
jgi:hypothetical protein